MSVKKTKTLEETQELHSEMLATAHDIGLEVPEELRGDITDAGAGAIICSNLDTLIREHRSKGVASDVNSGDTAPPAPSSVKKPARAASSPKKAKQAPAIPAGAKTEEKEEVAKTAKKAKTASKKKAATNARTRLDEKAKITKIGDNPAREGTGKHARIANVLKHNGKTVGTYLGAGKGKTGTLSWCVKQKIVKVA